MAGEHMGGKQQLISCADFHQSMFWIPILSLVAATHQSPSATFNPIPAQGNRLQYVLTCTHKP